MLRYPVSRVSSPIRSRKGAAFFLLAAILCGSSLAGFAQARHKEHKRDAKREIEGLEEQWRTAQLTGDEPAMERLLADDYLGISMTGQVNDRTQQLDRMRHRELVLTRIDLSEKKIKLVGPVAIVTSLAKIEGSSDGAPVNGMVRYTRIYRRYPDGTWKVTSFEVTRVPHSGTD